ncbi:11636_t:CDS:2 [Ambispora gerdemannii]|uniref:11636_t:CDS:1 n=1 Tax=Ambispora gerdemannii TaxID=144530 RepID=A0A9N9GNG8_9GLOM|nr:11636_t:CDS:2 [Ambispora gerdemannii]
MIQLDSNEISTYLSEPETEVESLLWWRANAMQYLILARIAMDYLAVQTTSVPKTARTSLCLRAGIWNWVI